MIIGGRRALLLLFAGDCAAFAVALYVTLALRYFALPSSETLTPHLIPFGLLFMFWALVFYGAGLYGKQIALFPSRLPNALLATQLANIVFAALFFFFIPAFGIAPKTILALYLVISLAAVFLWRLALYPQLVGRPKPERALLIADGSDASELLREVNSNSHYGLRFVTSSENEDLSRPGRLEEILRHEQATILVVDPSSATAQLLLPTIYELTHSVRQYQFVSFEDVYEEAFDRIPLSKLGHAWFLEHVVPINSFFYAIAKRSVDILGGMSMGVVALCVAPLIFIANHLEGPGPLFIRQERFGLRGVHITAYKFRSMQKSVAASGEWVNEGENRVTKVGAFLRKTSLDEFPQCINVLRGEVSLVGPRNDTLGLGQRLREALPYYEARYLVQPGITGWAQINQQYEQGNLSPQSIEETKMRLAYDFYYLKHRSFVLDILIALKTVKRMFFRVSAW